MRAMNYLASVLAGSVLLTGVAATKSASAAVPHHAGAHKVKEHSVELYQLTIRGPQGAATQDVQLLLERDGATLSGYLIRATEATALDGVTVQDGGIRAAVLTSGGRAVLLLLPSGDQVQGTLTVGKTVLTIQGVRSL
jgi:hypothetical protein